MRVLMLAGAVLLAPNLSGCLMNRTISQVTAHDSYNSYKVQTHSVYYAFFSAWQEWEVWSCHRDAQTYRCREIEYDENRNGISRPESAPVPATEPAVEPAAEPADAPVVPPTYPEGTSGQAGGES